MTRISTFFLIIFAIAANAYEARIDIDGAGARVRLEPLNAVNLSNEIPAKISNCSWRGGAAIYTLSASIMILPGECNKVRIEFMPLSDGELKLMLMGSYVKSEQLSQASVYWDNVRITGAKLLNADFESQSGWEQTGSQEEKTGFGLMPTPKWFGRGMCAKAWHNSRMVQSIRVTKGEKVVISADAGISPMLREMKFRQSDLASGMNKLIEIPLEKLDKYLCSQILRFSPDKYLQITSEQPWDPGSQIAGVSDLMGPDGIFYPDFRRAGLQKPITEFKVVTKLSDFGARPGKDIADALEKAIDNTPDSGGVIMIGKGRFILRRPVLISRSNIIIRGQGVNETSIDFNFGLPPKGVRLFCSSLRGTYETAAEKMIIPVNSMGDIISIQADPTHLKKIIVRINNTEICKEDRKQRSPVRYRGVFSLDVMGYMILKKIKAGLHTLNAVISWDDGTETILKRQIAISKNPKNTGTVVHRNNIAAINISKMSRGQSYPVTGKASRGCTSLTLSRTSGLYPGDYIELKADPTKRFIREIRSACPGTPRHQWLKITKIDGNTVFLNQPLRLDFPLIDKPRAIKLSLLENIGIEDFTLNQENCNLWIHGIMMKGVVNSWIKRVNVLNTGRNPVELSGKFCAITDCNFIGSQYNDGHGGGTAYVGFRQAYDCIMENIKSVGMRHGPNIDSSSSGCVIRNSSFVGSDGQFHFYYPYENLIENCVVDAKFGTGSYGYGFFSQEPEVSEHGPQGPGNVIYNCDFSSPYSGFWAGGSTAGYRIMYNRFRVGYGTGIFAKFGAFNYVAMGNVFCIRQAYPSGIYLATPDCSGWIIADNKFFFNTKVPAIGGLGAGAKISNNHVFKYRDAERPTPPTPSLLDWQRRKYPLTHNL